MLAIDPFGTSPAGDYLTLFQRYVARSIEALYARITPDLQELSASQISTETREQAWHLLDYGLKLAQGWEVVRKLLLVIAPHLERDGFRHEWLPYLERGVAASRLASDVKSEAQLSLYVGRIYRLRGELGQAHSWFEASAALCQQLGDTRGRALALNQLGYVARLKSSYGAAQAYIDEALTLLAEHDSERATSYSWLGAIAYDQMDWARAEAYYQQAYQIWQEAHDPQRAAWSLQNLGDTMRSAGKYTEAALYIQQAIVLLGQLHDPVNQAIARMNLGALFENQNKLPEALALYALAERTLHQAEDKLHLAMLHHNMAIVYRLQEEWQAAELASQKAIRVWEILGEVKRMINTMDELGLVYMGQRRFDKAIATFSYALELLEQVPSGPIYNSLYEMVVPHLAEAQQQGRKLVGGG
jgi:tetratricopeptide (TPR) repeat protein